LSGLTGCLCGSRGTGCKSNTIFSSATKGIHGLCAPGYSSDYRIPCQEMNMLPGIKQDGELAASSIGLHADQYGTPSELVFNMGGQNRAGYYLDRAVISYKKERHKILDN